MTNYRYNKGFKRCTHCDMFVKTDGFRCPTCNNKLRMKPRRKSQIDNKNNYWFRVRKPRLEAERKRLDELGVR
jgi:DNA-directed RNA polymerase subunit RPC12/RpoP